MEQVKHDDLPPGLLRQRRNLILVSLLLITYEIAGGEFTSTSLSVIGVKFNNPNFLHLMIWLSFTYLWLRYSTYSLHLKSDLEFSINYAICSRTDYKEMAQEIYVKEVTKEQWEKILAHKERADIIDQIRAPRLERKWFRRILHYSRSILERNFDITQYEYTPAPKVEVSILKTIIFEIMSEARVLATEKIFLDYAFPHFLAMTTVFIGIFNIATYFEIVGK